MTSLLLFVLTLLTVAAWGVALVRLRRSTAGGPSAQPMVASGMQQALVATVTAVGGLLFAYRWLVLHGSWQPLSAHVDGLLLIAVLFAAVVLFVQSRRGLFGLSAFALPVLAVILAWAICAAYWTYDPFNLDTLHPVWNGLHLAGVYLGTLASALAAGVAGMFLYVRHRLKHKHGLAGFGRLASLETLERLLIRAASVGFVLLTLGLAAGVIILIEEPGQFQMTPVYAAKIALAATAWLTYALLMNVRFATAFRGPRAAWLAIAGLAVLLLTYALVTSLGTEQVEAGDVDAAADARKTHSSLRSVWHPSHTHSEGGA